MIDLPFGGQFDERELVAHINASRRDYIIQGQQGASLANQSKPHSLDYWLRQLSPNPNVKQAENSVLNALVKTGLFEIVNDLICPDSGERCKGIRLTPKAQAPIDSQMLEIDVTTTDGAFVSGLNAAKLEGVRAEYRPTMAFDTAEHICQIIVSMAPSAATLFTAWLTHRLKKTPAPPTVTINNHTTINAQNVVQIIQQIVEQPGDKK